MTDEARITPALIEAQERLIGVLTDPWATHFARHQARRSADDVLRLAASHPDGRVLNVGGAPYLFEVFAKEHGLVVDTLDIDPDRHAGVIGHYGLSVRAADFENASDRATIDLSAYDVIALCEVFEHMRIDLVGMMRDVRRRMRPDAIVYLTTPNFFYAPRYIKTLKKGTSGPSLVSEWRKLADIGHMGHIREYSRAELTEFFEFCGFSCEFAYRNSRPSSGKLGTFLSRFDRFCQEFVITLRPDRTAAESQ